MTVSTLVSVILGLVGGVILDRMDRRHALYLYAGISTLVWGMISILILTGTISLLALWIAAIVAAANGALFGGASNAALLSVVQGGTYAKAMAANQGRDAVLGLVAPPLGGMLYGLARVLPFAVSALFSLLVIPATKAITANLAPPPAEPKHFMSELMDGLRYAWANANRKTLMIMLICVNTIGAFLMGGVVYWMMQIKTSAFKIGLAEAITAAMMLLGSVIAPKIMDKIKPGTAIIAALLWLVIAFGVTAIFPTYWGLVFGEALAALPLPLASSLIAGYYFATVKVGMQGRVQSVLGVATNGLSAVPPALLGFLLPAFGYVPVALVALAVLLAVTLVFGRTATIRHMPKVADWPTPDE